MGLLIQTYLFSGDYTIEIILFMFYPPASLHHLDAEMDKMENETFNTIRLGTLRTTSWVNCFYKMDE